MSFVPSNTQTIQIDTTNGPQEYTLPANPGRDLTVTIHDIGDGIFVADGSDQKKAFDILILNSGSNFDDGDALLLAIADDIRLAITNPFI